MDLLRTDRAATETPFFKLFFVFERNAPIRTCRIQKESLGLLSGIGASPICLSAYSTCACSLPSEPLTVAGNFPHKGGKKIRCSLLRGLQALWCRFSGEMLSPSSYNSQPDSIKQRPQGWKHEPPIAPAESVDALLIPTLQKPN